MSIFLDWKYLRVMNQTVAPDSVITIKRNQIVFQTSNLSIEIDKLLLISEIRTSGSSNTKNQCIQSSIPDSFESQTSNNESLTH